MGHPYVGLPKQTDIKDLQVIGYSEEHAKSAANLGNDHEKLNRPKFK